MQNKRIKYSEAQQIALVYQADGICPLCSESLFYKKQGRQYKDYELAHIFPLNPTQEEIDLLRDEERLAADVNDANNIIPLCKTCHGRFDNPRTVEEYKKLYSIKKRLIDRTNQQVILKEYKIEAQISEVITALYNLPDIDLNAEIDFTPKTIDEKLDYTITNLTKQKIKNNVRDYYVFVRRALFELDQKYVDISDAISCQVKAYYVRQKSMGITQQEIFENVVTWLKVKTKPETSEATEILASFYVQNCEVF